MKTATVYSSRNNENGKQPENKMFWNIYHQDFSGQLKDMEKCHRLLYEEIVAPVSGKKTFASTMDHPACQKLKKILKVIYEGTGYVALDMFLYAAKAIPNLLPGDNIERKFSGRDISNAYINMLAHFMDRSIREYEQKDKGNTSDNPNIRAYIHILADWPKNGTWNEIQRLAIRIYGAMKTTSCEIEEEIYHALEKEYNYRSAFDVLICVATRHPSKECLIKLLQFLCTKYYVQKNIYCTDSMYQDFGKIMDQLSETNAELYEELRRIYQETKDSKYSNPVLNEIFKVAEEDPLKEVEGKSEEEIEKYIYSHYVPASFQWRHWLKNLGNVSYFKVVKNHFEQIVYPSGSIRSISFMLCAFAEMRMLEQGRQYVRKIHNATLFQQSEQSPALQCVLLCARQLAGELISINVILNLYEQLSLEEVQEVQYTVRILIRREKNKEVTKDRIQRDVEKAEHGDENSVIGLLNRLCRCYQFQKDAGLRSAIIPTDQVMDIIAKRCGLDTCNSVFRTKPPTELFLSSINYIESDITVENKMKYKSFLHAASQLNSDYRAENILRGYFSSDING